MDDLIKTKTCPKCKFPKTYAEFFTDNSRYDKLSPYCKQCIKDREAKPERVAKRKAYKAGYHLLHAEEINAKSVQWGKDNAERMAAKNKRSKKKRILEQVAAGEREMPRKRRNRAQALEAGEKECSQCEMVKPLGDFYPWTRSPDGVQSECKDCHDGRSQPIYDRDATIAEKACSQCGETKAASEFYDDPYRRSGIKAACKTCTDAKNTEWADANPDKHKAIANGYASRARQDPVQGPIIRARLHRRRALIKQAPIIDPIIDVVVLYQRNAGICTLCDNPVDHTLVHPHPLSKTIDHTVPLSLRGPHSYANTKLAHLYCNTLKNNRLETPELLARIRQRFQVKFGTRAPVPPQMCQLELL